MLARVAVRLTHRMVVFEEVLRRVEISTPNLYTSDTKFDNTFRDNSICMHLRARGTGRTSLVQLKCKILVQLRCAQQTGNSTTIGSSQNTRIHYLQMLCAPREFNGTSPEKRKTWFSMWRWWWGAQFCSWNMSANRISLLHWASHTLDARANTSKRNFVDL